jgi:two-component system chemotaxis response regulator CheB
VPSGESPVGKRWNGGSSDAVTARTGPQSAPLSLQRPRCYSLRMRDEAPPWFVAVGASGSEGLSDIKALLAALPPRIPAVVLVVLHRRWAQPSRLKAILARACPHPVLIAEEGERFERGSVYIGEPDQHLTLAMQNFGRLVDDPERAHGNRTIDLLFRSVARRENGRMIGVVLSGSLDDGSRGLAAIHDAGGLTMVLTPGLLPRKGMPENAIAYDGPIDTIGNPRLIANAIVRAIAKG